jgi:hypothetical protein
MTVSHESWVPLHTAGLALPVSGGRDDSSLTGGGKDKDADTGGECGGRIGLALVSAAQEWSFDTAAFENGSVPGDTRFFDLGCAQIGNNCNANKQSPSANTTGPRSPGENAGFRRVRVLFLSDRRAFSVQLSGLLLLCTHVRS